MKNKICPICNIYFNKLMRHIRSSHPELYEEECQKALRLFRTGLTLREIGNSNLTFWSFGEGLANVIEQSISAQELEVLRKERISQTMRLGFEYNLYSLSGRGRKKVSEQIENSIDEHPNKVLTWKGRKLTKDFLISLNSTDTIKLQKALFDYISKCDILKYYYTDNELQQEWKNLQNAKLNFNDNIITNISSTGNKIYKYFFPNMLEMTGHSGKQSIYNAINDPGTLKKIISNRLDKKILLNYSGNITKNMIIQGAKASGCAFSGSQFKPVVAKAIYEKYIKNGDKVLDYSCGFGSRMLGLFSLGLNDIEYYGYEPCIKTYNGLIKLASYFDFPISIKKCGSETEIFDQKFDFIFSSPPYFNTEIYSNEETQCYNKYTEYNEWLIKYWQKTVQNIKEMMKKDTIFGVNIGNNANKKMVKIAEDFKRIIESEGFCYKETLWLKTSVFHLTNKTGRYKYKFEGMFFYTLPSMK